MDNIPNEDNCKNLLIYGRIDFSQSLRFREGKVVIAQKDSIFTVLVVRSYITKFEAASFSYDNNGVLSHPYRIRFIQYDRGFGFETF